MTIMTYEIGYGKPPENTRFQKGNKYYLKRRPFAIINDTSKAGPCNLWAGMKRTPPLSRPRPMQEGRSPYGLR
jgi:hypothetical protein